MANHDIQKSRHLLKRLEEEMIFLRSIIAQMESVSSQAQFVSSSIKRTWSDIDKTYRSYTEGTEN
jgi:hypothetical protein